MTKVATSKVNNKTVKNVASKRMFSLLVDQELLWKWSIVAAHEKRKKRDMVLSLLMPYIDSKYEEIFKNK